MMDTRNTTNANLSESSQSIVDELFKDFISKKIKKQSNKDITSGAQSSKDHVARNKRSSRSSRDHMTPRPDKVDEINKLLDMEIISIQAHTKDSIASERVNPPSVYISDLEKKDSISDTNGVSILTTEISASSILSECTNSFSTKFSFPISNELSVPTSDIPMPPEISSNSSSTSSSAVSVDASSVGLSSSSLSRYLSISSAVKPTPSGGKVEGQTAKKIMIPKQLDCMLSSESLSLIKSKDRIDKNQRVWEEGEVASSQGEDSMKGDSDSDDEDDDPSETGSINSGEETWSLKSSSKHKKKHKHKHKKKKKKRSSKERDRSSKSSNNEKDRKKDKDKDKERDKSSKSGDKEIDREKDKVKDHSSKSEDHDGEKDKDVIKGLPVSDTKDRDLSHKSHNKDEKKDDDTEKAKEKRSYSSSSRKDDLDKSDRRHREKEKKRKRERSRSRTPKKSKKSRSRSKSPRRSKRSASPRRSHYGEWDARSYSNGSKKSSKDQSRSRSRSPKRRKSSESRSKKSEDKDASKDLRLQIDKAKLRKIAIANTLNSLKTSGVSQLPSQIGGQLGVVPPVAPLDIVSVKSGGKSVEELTDFCKRISEKEQDNVVSDSSDDEVGKGQSDEEEPLIHHPFKVKDATSSIVMNIRNARQLPVMTPTEKQAQQSTLRLAFPVSSGSHHRANESEWVPVQRTTAPLTSTANKTTDSKASSSSQPTPTKSIFPETTQKVDIGAIISERLQAVRKLQSNPYDVQALSSMHKVQEKASQWVQSKYLPGQFTGSTGASVMSQAEIMGDKRRQAWAKKTQFQTAAPVSGGIGMHLLQKMGWKQGEGLGKNQEGSLEPLQLDIKIDRKGLSTAADNPKARLQGGAKPKTGPVVKAKDLSHKHPVSAVMELCNRRHWPPPQFTIVSENGPDHKKVFLFKVKVNNIEYQPAVPSGNKKSAKAQCAAICLQEMGLLPRDASINF